MKRVLTCAGGLLLSFVCVSAVYAGAIDNKTNWSAEYIRTLNRNAATDYADIAAYNPAGTVKLADGFIINGSAQYLSKEYKNIIAGTSFESDEPSVVPGIFGVYNRDRWSVFGAITVVGGGGEVDFNQGNWTTKQIASMYPGVTGEQLNGKSFYIGYTLGSAFKINDIFSLSVGLRYVDASKELNASIVYAGGALTETFDFEQNGDGWGGIFGVNIAPNDKLNIGIRYEMETSLDLKATVHSGNPLILGSFGIVDGQSTPRDLPALFGFGLSYWLTPQLRLETNWTSYFNDGADWDGAELLVDDGYDVGIALEYHFSDSLLASIGYIHTKLGVEPQDMLPENPELDANTIGAGIAYAFNEKFHTNFSIGNSFYEDDSFVAPPTVEYQKNVFFMALGLEYRFM